MVEIGFLFSLSTISGGSREGGDSFGHHGRVRAPQAFFFLQWEHMVNYCFSYNLQFCYDGNSNFPDVFAMFLGYLWLL